MMSDLRSKLAASGTLLVPMRGGKTLPTDVSLKVLRFASTQDLGCLGRANTTWRDLSLRELTRLPGDWQLRRMGAPDHRVYFRSVAHERAQWEKPSRAAPPPAVDATSDGTPADVYPPQHHWPGRPAPRPKQTWARASARPSARPPDRPSARTRARRRLRQLFRPQAPPWACPACTYKHRRRSRLPSVRGVRRPQTHRNPRLATGRWPGLATTCSGARTTEASQWERPVYEDAPRFRPLDMPGLIRRANAHYRTRAGSSIDRCRDRSP